ncbi:MAG: hypothetical protein IT286_00605 [Proteobacteria bacterium]|jgi:hypothetical protein|nr:hypothetical protein [Pseudomonadota bacterium]
MKNFAAVLFFILPTIVFAQEAKFDPEQGYEVEGYKFEKKPSTEKANPDLKRFELANEFELLESKIYTPPLAQVAQAGEETKQGAIVVKVSMGVEVAEYEAVENITHECSKAWTVEVVGYFMEHFEKKNIQITPEQFTSSYCLNGVKYSIEE